MLESETYKLCGDFVHVFTFLYLFLVLIWKKNANGISGKTQLLYAITFTLRYVHLWWYKTWWPPQASLILEIYYTVITYLVTYLVYSSFRESYKREHDSFQIFYIILPASIMALCYQESLNVLDTLSQCSMYIETLALLPQLYMIWKSSSYSPKMSVIVFTYLVGIYRGLYLLSWFHQYQEGQSSYSQVELYSGVLEAVIALVGLLCIISLKIRLWSCDNYSSQPRTIYTLPVCQDQFRKDYKPLIDTDRRVSSEKRPILVNSNFVGHDNDRTSQNSFYVI